MCGMKKGMLRSAAVVAGVVVSLAQAELNTIGLRRIITERVVDDVVVYDTSYVESSYTATHLRAVTVTVKPCGAYLDIVEEAVVAPQTSGMSGVVENRIVGSLELPERSTVVGFQLSTPEDDYEARVEPAVQVDSMIDTTRGEQVASLTYGGRSSYYRWRDGRSLIENRNRFDITIEQVKPGKEYRTRFRYLVPNTGTPAAIYHLSVLQHCYAESPGVLELVYEEGDVSGACVLSVNGLKYALEGNKSIQIPYQQTFQIAISPEAESMMHMTNVDDGDWSGKYLLLNTAIPEEILQQLSAEMELVVLWRWNQPKTFVEKYESHYYSDYVVEPTVIPTPDLRVPIGRKYLTGYGYQAVTQATAIGNLVDEVTKCGSRAGLVHSVQREETETFPLCRRNTDDFVRLQSYLVQFDREYFVNSDDYCHLPGGASGSVVDSTSGKEFVSSIKLVHGLYSNGEGIKKHLIIATCGPATASREVVRLEEVDGILREMSVDCANAVWTDVNFGTVQNNARDEALIPMGQFNVPEFRPHSLMLSVRSESKEYLFPLSPDQASFSILAKSASDWNPRLEWIGYDRSGAVMNSAALEATVHEADNDTGLIKLWAATNERLNDEWEKNVDKRYGVVSPLYSLKMYPSYQGYEDKVGFAAIEETYAAEPDDITGIVPADATGVQGLSELHCRLDKNGLSIVLPGAAHARHIRFYTLAGRLLAEIDPQRYSSGHGYFVPLRLLLQHAARQGVVLVRIEGVEGNWTRRIILR